MGGTDRCIEDNRIAHKISALRPDGKNLLCRIGFRMENNIKTEEKIKLKNVH
jgi:hypothetical protein